MRPGKGHISGGNDQTMGDSIKQVCQLCIEKPPPCELENIDAKNKEMLGILLINMNFNISNYAVACKRCLKRLQDSFDFKTHCITTVMETGNKTDDKKVFAMEMMGSTENICLDLPICCLCISSFIPDKDFNEVADLSTGVLFKDMIRNCLPEMELNAIQESLICKSCLKSLKNCYKFIEDCREVKRLCHLADHGTADMPTEEMLISKIKSEDTEELGKLAIIVKEESFVDAENYVNPLMFPINEDIATIKCEELHIKEEVDVGEEMGDSIPMEACSDSAKSCSLMRKSASKGRKLVSSEYDIGRHKGPTKVFGIQECTFKNERNHILARRRRMIRHKNKPDLQMHKCGTKNKTRKLNSQLSHQREKCAKIKDERYPYKTDIKSNLGTYKCEDCEYENRWKGNLIQHMMHHHAKAERTFKCDDCSYETNIMSSLRAHNMIHKGRSEVKMFQCENCEYATWRKGHMNRHVLLKHSDPSAERQFKCDECSFETDTKYCLRRHNMMHKDRSEVKMYKCENCEYEAKQKGNLIYHMLLKHSDPKGESRFKCDKCPYQTNIKGSLRRHNLIHKGRLEAKMNKCESCEYATWEKSSLIRHVLLRHSDPKAEKEFKCDKCSYETDVKGNLWRHNLIHKDKSEVEMYKCATCEYETRRKCDLKKHMLLRHSDSRGERKFNCDQCSFETDIEGRLRAHSMVHKDRSGVEMHKCENCEYETKQKCNLIRHMLLKHSDPKAEKKFSDIYSYEMDIKGNPRAHNVVHQDRSVEMLKCYNCEYETKVKRSLVRHMLKHRDPKAETKFCDK